MFDDLESKIADTQLLIANRFAQNVKLELVPFSQLTELAAEVRNNVSLGWLLMQPAARYTFGQFLRDSENEGLMEFMFGVGLFLHVRRNSERIEKFRKIMEKYFSAPNALKLVDSEVGEAEKIAALAKILDKKDVEGISGTTTSPVKEKREQNQNEMELEISSTVFEPLVALIKKRLTELFLPQFLQSPQFELFIQYKSYARRPVNLDSFHAFRVLGRGAFGAVRAVRKFDTQRMFAMKVMSKGQIKQKQEFKMVINERNSLALTEQNSPGNPKARVLTLKYAFKDSKNVYLVTQYCSGGDLGYHLRNVNGKFDEARARHYVAEVVLGLEVLHKVSLIYRDLKPENLLLNADGHCILSDLGLSKKLRTDRPISNACGTPGYWAPEVMQRKFQNFSSDYWSVGVLLYKFLTGHIPESTVNHEKLEFSPFSRLAKDEEIAKMVNSNPVVNIKWPESVSPLAMDLISQFFNFDIETRLGAKGAADVKKHPFFASIDWDRLADGELKPPFIPSQDTVYAEAQGFREVENEYENVKWSQEEEDVFKYFDYCSEMSAQAEIVDSLTDVREKLPDIPPESCGCCLVA